MTRAKRPPTYAAGIPRWYDVQVFEVSRSAHAEQGLSIDDAIHQAGGCLDGKVLREHRSIQIRLDEQHPPFREILSDADRESDRDSRFALAAYRTTHCNGIGRKAGSRACIDAAE